MFDYHFGKWWAQIYSFPTRLILRQQAFQCTTIFNSFKFWMIFASFRDKINQPHETSQLCERVVSSNHVRRFLLLLLLFLFVYLFSFLFLLSYHAFMKLRTLLPKQKCKSVDFSPTC